MNERDRFCLRFTSPWPRLQRFVNHRHSCWGKNPKISGGRAGANKDALTLTGVGASVVHVGGNEAPLVCGWVVKLHRGQIAGAVVSSDHVQQPVNGTDAFEEKHKGERVDLL